MKKKIGQGMASYEPIRYFGESPGFVERVVLLAVAALASAFNVQVIPDECTTVQLSEADMKRRIAAQISEIEDNLKHGRDTF